MAWVRYGLGFRVQSFRALNFRFSEGGENLVAMQLLRFSGLTSKLQVYNSHPSWSLQSKVYKHYLLWASGSQAKHRQSPWWVVFTTSMWGFHSRDSQHQFASE